MHSSLIDMQSGSLKHVILGVKSTNIFRREVTWHIIFWMIYLFIRIEIIQLYPGTFLYRMGLELIELPLKIFALYVAIYYLIEKLLLRKHYAKFLVAFTTYLLLVTLLNRVEDYYIIYPLTEDSVSIYQSSTNLTSSFWQSSITRHEDGFWSVRAAFINLIYIYPVVGLGAAIYFAKGWYTDRLNHERVLREKLQTELKLLKDQLHPHFLFNTLNNIYSLSLQQSAKAPEMILKLSGLLNFMIYDGMSQTIPLRKELQALKDYIELERLRLNTRLELTFEATGDIDQQQVPPMLLFPFVENCFKHGSHKTTEKVWISFNLVAQGDTLIAQIENSVPGELSNATGQGSGIGLANVQRRLELLYPGRYELRIHREETYLVKLKLKLS